MIASYKIKKALFPLLVYSISSLSISLLFHYLDFQESSFLYYPSFTSSYWGISFILLMASQYLAYLLMENSFSEINNRQLIGSATLFGTIFCFLVLFIVQLSYSILFV